MPPMVNDRANAIVCGWKVHQVCRALEVTAGLLFCESDISTQNVFGYGKQYSHANAYPNVYVCLSFGPVSMSKKKRYNKAT